MPAQDITKITVSFSAGDQALLTIVSPNTPDKAIVSALALPAYQSVLMVFGGAASLPDTAADSLRSLFGEGLMPALKNSGAIIIDGGTQAGVMQVMGECVAADDHHIQLIGVAPEKLVTYPGGPGDQGVQLDPN